MPPSKRLIVGLGNPGAKYEGTRHNVGFVVVNALAAQMDVSLTAGRFNALEGWGRYGDRPFGLALPLTYVNRSGEAVKPLLNYNNVDPANLLVVVDDLHLDVGVLRLRPGGGSGGHNGLTHIAQVLGTTDFPRLRIGVGNDYRKGEQANYVLSRFTPEQKPAINETLDRACEAARTFIRDGIEAAMNQYN